MGKIDERKRNRGNLYNYTLIKMSTIEAKRVEE